MTWVYDYIRGAMVMESERNNRPRGPRAVTFRISDVKSQPLRWLWENMIPRGKLTVMCGDPGLGKSFMTLDILSRISTGSPMPGEAEFGAGAGLGVGVGECTTMRREPMSGILLSAEDDPSDTIRPRLEVMGANLEKAIVFDGVEQANGDVFDFVLGENIKQLYELVEQTGDVGLVVVDPISAYVGETDSYNNAQVRAMLKPLSDMAADLDVAVVLVTHLRKGDAEKAVHRAMGSLAFTAAARTVLVVTKDPDDPDLRVVLVAKSNVGKDRMGWTYRIDGGKVVWVSQIQAGADEFLAKSAATKPGAGRGGRPSNPSIDKFADDLRWLMSQSPDGKVLVGVIKKLATRNGLAFETVSQTKTRARYGFVSCDRNVVPAWRNREPGEDEA